MGEKLNSEIVAFVAHRNSKIDGMLNKSAAFSALLLCNIIEVEIGWDDTAFLEIGVYKGKFLNIVQRATQAYNTKIVGVDPFNLPNQQIENVIESIKETGGSFDRVLLHQGYSSEIQNIENLINPNPLMFAHVDGDHKFATVIKDIDFIDKALHEKGCVLFDDFWNVSHLGVLSAIVEYLKLGEGRLQPVALMNKKLLMSDAKYVDFYKQKIILFASYNTHMGVFKNLIDKTEKYRFSSFLGYDILIV